MESEPESADAGEDGVVVPLTGPDEFVIQFC